MAHTQKNCKVDFKEKTFAQQNTMLRGLKEATYWGEISANHLYDKGLVFRIIQEISNLDRKKIEKMTRVYTLFTVEDRLHMKR